MISRSKLSHEKQSSPFERKSELSHQDQFADAFEEFKSSKVEFFSASSILDQVSLDDEEIYHNENMIQYEVNTVFAMLHNELTPNLTHESQQKLTLIMNRANILYKSTILDFFTQSKRLNVEPRTQVINSYEKIKILINDYHSYQKDSLSYEEFYSIYKPTRKIEEGTPRSMLNSPVKAQKIGFEVFQKIQIVYKEEIINSCRKSALKPQNLTARSNFNKVSEQKALLSTADQKTQSLIQKINKLKQINGYLNEQIYFFRTKLRSLQEFHKKQLFEASSMFNQRLDSIINTKLSICKNANSFQKQEDVLTVRQSLQKQSSKDPVQLMIQTQRLIKELKKAQNQIQMQTEQISNLNEVVASLKVLNNHLQNQNSKSKLLEKTQFNPLPSKNDQKYFQILNQQIYLLKKQVQSERDKVYQLTLRKNFEKQEEVKRLKQSLARAIQQTKLQNIEMDKVKISQKIKEEELLKIQEENKVLKLSIENSLSELQSLKNSKLSTQYMNEFQRTGFSFHQQKNQQLFPSSPLRSHLSYQSQRLFKSKIVKISPFLSDVLEGFVYFQSLQRQYRFRYLRACFREKELLYKKNDFEVGVISKLAQEKDETKLKFILYLTNSTQNSIENLSLKFVNSNSSNQVSLKNNCKQYFLKPGEQVKVPLQISAWSYPLGSVSILISGLKEDVRLLLPFNILKLFIFNEAFINRKDIKTNSEYLKLKCETNVMKSFQWLIEGLLKCKKNEKCKNQLGLTACHQQTGTKVKIWLQHNSQRETLEIWYFKEVGSLDLADYLMKSLKLILQKEKK